MSLFSGFFMTGSMPEVSFPPVYGIAEPAAALSPERTLLFAVLREFDDEKVTKIYSEGFSDQGLGQAIMNRLLKAAGHRVVRV